MYLVDTNILIYYLDGVPSVIEFISQNRPLAISVISVIEVLSYPYEDDERLVVMAFLRDNFKWFYVNEDIALLTAHHRTLKKVKTPDAIIGATVIHHQCTLITNNTKDFCSFTHHHL